MNERISYEESFRRLQERGHFPGKAVPPIRPQTPSIQDEEPLGISFFRTLAGEVSLGALGCRLPLSEVYARVQFAPSQEGAERGTE